MEAPHRLSQPLLLPVCPASPFPDKRASNTVGPWTSGWINLAFWGMTVYYIYNLKVLGTSDCCSPNLERQQVDGKCPWLGWSQIQLAPLRPTPLSQFIKAWHEWTSIPCKGRNIHHFYLAATPPPHHEQVKALWDVKGSTTWIAIAATRSMSLSTVDNSQMNTSNN